MIRRPCSSGSKAWSSRPEPKSPEGGRKYPCLPRCPCPSRQQAEEKMARSRQREEGPPLARFLRRSVSTKDRRVCPLDFLHVGGGILPSCPTTDAPRLRSSRSPRASIRSPNLSAPQTKRRLKHPSRHTGRLAVRRPEPRTKVHNKRDAPCTGASLVLLSAVSRPLVSSLPERLGKDGSRKTPFSCAGQGGSFEDLSSTTWAARWDRRTSSRSAGDRWRSGPWRR